MLKTSKFKKETNFKKVKKYCPKSKLLNKIYIYYCNKVNQFITVLKTAKYLFTKHHGRMNLCTRIVTCHFGYPPVHVPEPEDVSKLVHQRFRFPESSKNIYVHDNTTCGNIIRHGHPYFCVVLGF